MDSLLSRLAERPRVWPSQQEWMLAELALLIERSDRLNLQRVHAALAPDARLGRPGATRLLLDLVHESILLLLREAFCTDHGGGWDGLVH